MSETITTNAREGIQKLGIVEAAPVGWDGTEDMPEEYGHMCMALTAETLTRAGMDVLGLLDDTDLVFMEGGEVCVGIVTPLSSQLIGAHHSSHGTSPSIRPRSRSFLVVTLCESYSTSANDVWRCILTPPDDAFYLHLYYRVYRVWRAFRGRVHRISTLV